MCIIAVVKTDNNKCVTPEGIQYCPKITRLHAKQNRVDMFHGKPCAIRASCLWPATLLTGDAAGGFPQCVQVEFKKKYENVMQLDLRTPSQHTAFLQRRQIEFTEKYARMSCSLTFSALSRVMPGIQLVTQLERLIWFIFTC